MPDEDNILTDELRKEIDSMSHVDMMRLWRYAPWGHVMFRQGDVFDYWDARFQRLGGITSQVSHAVGWEDQDEFPNVSRNK